MSDKIEVTIVRWLRAETSFVLDRPATRAELMGLIDELDGYTRTVVETDEGIAIDLGGLIPVQGQKALLSYHDSTVQIRSTPELENDVEIKRLEGEQAVTLGELYPEEAA
jgi:hypothetical protein